MGPTSSSGRVCRALRNFQRANITSGGRLKPFEGRSRRFTRLVLYCGNSFEVKHDITQYARSLGGMRVIDVQPGIFASNFTELQPPIKVSENEYILPLAYDADTQLPVVDMSADYGRYALGALEHGVDTLLAAGEVVTPVRIAEVLSKGASPSLKE